MGISYHYQMTFVIYHQQISQQISQEISQQVTLLTRVMWYVLDGFPHISSTYHNFGYIVGKCLDRFYGS